MSIILTNEQENGVKLAKSWWQNDKLDPFIINGYAGCGKSTLVSHIVDGLDLGLDEIRFATFTGAASSVLTAKGNPASTIHRLIYDPKITKDGKVIFTLKNELPEEVKLLIVDEYSQVNNELMQDILSFNIPVILLGDPEQHKSFSGKPNPFMNKCDVMLSKPMRQALDNPIIYLATMIREGKRINYGTMGDNVYIIPKEEVKDEYMISVDQILASKNATVDNINNHIRKNIYGLESPFPYIGEKICCLKNNWSKFITYKDVDWYLFNGMSGYVSGMGDYNNNLHSFKIDFKPTFIDEEDKNSFKGIMADGIYFLENIRKDDPLYKDIDLMETYKDTLFKRKVEFDSNRIIVDKFQYNYCQTTYKSQGSEYDSVLYIDEFMGKDYQRAARYVGVTRAKKKVIFAM